MNLNHHQQSNAGMKHPEEVALDMLDYDDPRTPSGPEDGEMNGMSRTGSAKPILSNNHRILYVFLPVYSVLLACFSLYIFSITLGTTLMYHAIFDLLHAQTISSIILGLKPLINAITILIMTINVRKHDEYFACLCRLNRTFAGEFGFSPNLRYLNYFTIFTSFGTFAAFFTLRMIEFFWLEERFGMGIMDDAAFIIVPMLTTVSVVPLVYFEMSNRIVRYWCRQLAKSIKANCEKGTKGLRYYYDQFLVITEVQEQLGVFFSPFIMFSLGWTIFSLCLTIYFATQSSAHFAPLPEDLANKPEDSKWLLIVIFNQTYGLLQVLLSGIYITVMCFTGTATNEQTSCFIAKMHTQYYWGITVWRAFPLERGAFFTIVSMICTYAFLLLRFRQAHPVNSQDCQSAFEALSNFSLVAEHSNASFLWHLTVPKEL